MNLSWKARATLTEAAKKYFPARVMDAPEDDKVSAGLASDGALLNARCVAFDTAFTRFECVEFFRCLSKSVEV